MVLDRRRRRRATPPSRAPPPPPAPASRESWSSRGARSPASGRSASASRAACGNGSGRAARSACVTARALPRDGPAARASPGGAARRRCASGTRRRRHTPRRRRWRRCCRASRRASRSTPPRSSPRRCRRIRSTPRRPAARRPPLRGTACSSESGPSPSRSRRSEWQVGWYVREPRKVEPTSTAPIRSSRNSESSCVRPGTPRSSATSCGTCVRTCAAQEPDGVDDRLVAVEDLHESSAPASSPRPDGRR